MLDKVEIVIPTHWSTKGSANKAWGPPTTGWLEHTLNHLYKQCPETKKIKKTIVYNQSIYSKSPEYNCQYETHIRLLCGKMGLGLRLDSSPGYKGVRLDMRYWVHSKYLFLIEHDWEFLKPFSLEDIVQCMEENEHIHYIRFNKRANAIKPMPTSTGRAGGDLYLTPLKGSNAPLLATPQYSDNPHVERMSKYHEWCNIVEKSNLFAGKNGGAGGFEHPLQEQSLDDYRDLGNIRRDKLWGTYIYGNLDDSPMIKHIGV